MFITEIFNVSIFYIGIIEDLDLLACDSEYLDIRFSTIRTDVAGTT